MVTLMNSMLVQKNELEKSISQKETELVLVGNEIKDTFMRIDSLTNDLISVLSFGKQQVRIEKTKEEIEKENQKLNQLMVSKNKCIAELESLGKLRNHLVNEEMIKKEHEKKLKESLVNAITDMEKNIHSQYNELVRIKTDIIEGRLSIEELIENEKVTIGNLEFKMTPYSGY